MIIHGSCHCGNIGFRPDWHPEPSEVPARACSCTFCQKHGGVYAVVNVNTFEDFDPSMFRRASANFDGEDEAIRLARRARGWIPSVRFSAASVGGIGG